MGWTHEAFELGRQLQQEAAAAGITIPDVDAAALAVHRLEAGLLPQGRLTRADVMVAAAIACALGLLIEPDAMRAGGLSWPGWRSDGVDYAVRQWFAWQQGVALPALQRPRDHRSRLLRAAIRSPDFVGWDFRHANGAATDARIAHRLRVRRGMDMEPGDVAASLLVATRVSGSEPPVRMTETGLAIDEDSAADVLRSEAWRRVHKRANRHARRSAILSAPPPPRDPAEAAASVDAARMVREVLRERSARTADPALRAVRSNAEGSFGEGHRCPCQGELGRQGKSRCLGEAPPARVGSGGTGPSGSP